MHKSDEFRIIIKGCLEMSIEGVKYILNEEDSIYIKVNTKHSFKKLCVGECISY